MDAQATSSGAPAVVQPPHWIVSAAFLVLLMAAFATRAIPLMALALSTAALLIALYLATVRDSTLTERRACVFLVILITASLPLATIRGATAVLHYCVVLLSFGSAYVLTRDIGGYMLASRWALATVQAVMLAFLAHSGLDDFPLDRALTASSSNALTSMLIVLQANYCIARYLATRRVAWVTPSITLLICIAGWGRGSVLAALAIVAVSLPFLLPRSGPKAIASLVVCAAATLAVFAHYWEAITLFVEANTKLGGGLHDAHRLLEIQEYAARIDGATLLTGADYRGTTIETDYNNNPHNSYIRAHRIFGLPYVLLMLAFPWLLLSRGLSIDKLAYAMSMLVVILLRAFTEPILFPTIFDTFFFAICFALGRSIADRGFFASTPTRP